MKTMAQQQTENPSDVNNTDDNGKISGSSNLQNGTEPLSAPGKNSGHTHHQPQQPPHLHQQHPHPHQHPHPQQLNSRPPVQQLHQIPGNMNEKNQNTKSPPNQGGQQGGMMPSNNGGGEPQSHPYGSSSSEVGVGPPPQMSHYPPPMQQQPNTIENPNKDDPYNQQPPVGAHPYGRYHHHDPNVPPDPYGRYGHPGLQPGKPPGGMIPPNRPPQRYLPGQPPQGPTPTLNSLLQSHPPPPPQHRYPNNYDPQQQQQGSQQQPPPPPQSYGPQQGWAPPPRPYSPQLGPSQTYRTPPPANSSRGQSPYPPPGQSPGSYPPSPQSGPPPPTQGPPVSSQYSPYPQRYPTPPGPAGGPNHRSPYPPHQYPEPTRSWPGGPGGPSPAASPGPGSHPHPPASPHQTQHGGPPPSSPGHAPSPSPQPPQPSPSPHQYPNRPSQASTPNTNDIETGESIGQNSNDSSCGGVTGVGSGPPGTPNPQQAMRPTPSPTGSSGSRSMSPAVGQQSLPMPPRPSSSQSQSGLNQLPPTTVGVISNNSNIANAPHHHQHHQQSQQQQQQQVPPQNLDSSGSAPPRSQASGALPNSQPPPHQQQSGQGNSSMAAQGSYQTPPPPLSHMHGYKMGPTPGQGPGAGPQNMPPYPPPQSQQYSQGNYPPRPQYPGTYGPTPPPGQPPPSNMPPNTGQYPGRPMPNHVGAPHSQFPPYQQSWASPSPQTTNMMSNHVQGKGTPPPSQPNLGSPRPLNYLKQHLQHKGGYGGAQSPTPPQGYGNGPGMHPPMGPPHHMGPPLGPTSMGPPTSAPQNNPAPPTPPSGANSHSEGNSTPDPTVSQDNGVSSSAPSNVSSHPVTSVVTTGPDGAPLDEASQQSTLSNASAASGEDPQQCTTPKSRRSESCNQGHLAPPSASPGAHPHNEEFEMNSPSSWPRTPASPVFNSHVPQETYRISSKKSDSLCKLFEMDDNPDRRIWLDKLLGFMEERRTPITACPTISKQPLDLYRLYMLVKERGGFVEVTKSKTWKDIAGLLGIGASSSAAYTLRKHYTKNLLAFECHFDRGGIDPLPIIQQVEAGSKKKAAKAASVPSPVGSSNSQDSFPPPGASSGSMDSYPGYPGGYTPGTQTDYNAPPQMQRPPSQNSTQAPHAGNTQQSGGDNISVSNPFDDPVAATRSGPYKQGSTYPPVSRTQANAPYQGQPGGYSQYNAPDQYGGSAPPGQYPPGQGQFPPPNRTMYPQYGSENESAPPPSSSYVPYAPPPRPYNQPPSAAPQAQPPAASSQAPPGPAGTYPPPPPQQDYYRQPPEQMTKNSSPNSVNMSSQLARQLVAPMSPAKTSSYHHNSSQPRRHPDFAKEPQPYPPYGQRPQMYNWQNSSNQYRAQYPTQSSPQQWNSAQRPQGPPPSQSQTSAPQWDHSRYPPQNQQQYPPNQQQWSSMNSACPPTSQTTPLRPPQRGNAKPFTMPPPQGTKPTQPTQQPFAPAGQQQKRDIVFPPESIEATTPVLYKRKRLTKNDVCPVDPWRIFMALRSGLLCDSTWALDILNILLFDDTAVHYFGLRHLPGLLNLLLDHFQKNLSDMFDPNNEHKHGYGWNCFKKAHDEDDESDVDLGQVTNPPNPEERVLILTSTTNYTMSSRKGVPVRIQNSEDDIFISEFPKKWDLDSNKNYQLSVPVGSDPWTFGHEEPHPHDNIIDTFKAEIVDIPFARYLKSDRKDKIDSEDLDDDDMEGEHDEIDVKQEKNVSVAMAGRNKKRRILSKNCLADGSMGKRVKLKEMWKSSKLDFKTEIKQEVDDDGDQTADRTVKKEPMDSDCREVDMEIEPRMPNGPHQDESCPINDEDDEKMSADNNSVSEEKIKIEITKKSDSNCDKFDPKETVRDPSAILKRRRMSEYEDECYTRDEASLYLVNESHDTLARRCICLSNILRNLTFVPGNEAVLAKSSTFLALLGKLLLLNHEHLVRTQKTRNYDREEDTDFADSCSSLQGESEWWWDYLIQIRENMLVAVANIAGHLELSRYEEIITRPVLDGLLHWAVCPSAHGQDPFPSCGLHSALSPQRLALEALCKLCVTDANVDLVIATPPFSRLEKLCSVLTRHLCRNEDQVLREFSVNLLHYLAAADSAMSRTVALQSPCISYLVAFIEQAEQTALGVANQHGINYLRENPDSMGTSLDMLRRAAGTLLHLSKHPDNRPLFMQQEQRLLGLVMSHILDQQVALIISRVLFQVSRGTEPVTSSEFKLNQRRQQQKLKLENLMSSSSILSSSSCLIPSSNLQTSLSPALLHSGSNSNRSISPSNAASANLAVNLTSSTSSAVPSLNVENNSSFNYTNTNVATSNTSSNNNGSITSGNSSILNSNCNSNSSTSSGSSSCSSAANNNSSNSNSNNNSNNNSSNFCGEINRQQTNVSCSNNNSSSNISNLSNSNVSNNSSSNNNGNVSKNISTRATTNTSNSNSSTPTTAAVA